MIRFGAARALTDSDKEFFLCNKLTEKQIEIAQKAENSENATSDERWLAGRCWKRTANWIGPKWKHASFVFDLGCNTYIAYLALRNSRNGYFLNA